MLGRAVYKTARIPRTKTGAPNAGASCKAITDAHVTVLVPPLSNFVFQIFFQGAISPPYLLVPIFYFRRVTASSAPMTARRSVIGKLETRIGAFFLRSKY